MPPKKRQQDAFYVERSKPPKGRTRDRQFTMRLTESELAEMEERVRESGKSRSDFVLDAAREVRIVRVRDGAVRDELLALRAELLRQGNNLNQIAYRLNRAAKTRDGGAVLDAAYDVEEMIEEHQRLAKEIADAARRAVQ